MILAPRLHPDCGKNPKEKRRLLVESNAELVVMSLLESPSGHLTNLSTRTGVLK
ncbi:MAG: hypothetical protein OXP09_00595 [Gammaproteobacteria bacterium]|nr:hypothetical protein [Gammaproteobacteria bacterium]